MVHLRTFGNNATKRKSPFCKNAKGPFPNDKFEVGYDSAPMTASIFFFIVPASKGLMT